jgi:hypothetical protein
VRNTPSKIEFLRALGWASTGSQHLVRQITLAKCRARHSETATTAERTICFEVEARIWMVGGMWLYLGAYASNSHFSTSWINLLSSSSCLYAHLVAIYAALFGSLASCYGTLFDLNTNLGKSPSALSNSVPGVAWATYFRVCRWIVCSGSSIIRPRMFIVIRPTCEVE